MNSSKENEILYTQMIKKIERMVEDACKSDSKSDSKSNGLYHNS